MPLEYRVRWEREGKNPSHRIYQDISDAARKVRSIQAMDQIKGETERFEDMPDLVSIELQVREVGKWERDAHQPEASEYDLSGVRSHIYWRYGEGAPNDPPEPEGTAEIPF